TICYRDWSSDVCSSDLPERAVRDPGPEVNGSPPVILGGVSHVLPHGPTSTARCLRGTSGHGPRGRPGPRGLLAAVARPGPHEHLDRKDVGEGRVVTHDS